MSDGTAETGPGRMDRRAMLAGGAAWLAAPRQSAPIDWDAETRLVENLLTRMAIRVGLNGARDLLFVIDTGAERTVVATEVAQAIGLPAGPTQLVHGVTAAVLAPTVHIERFIVGGRTLEDLTAPTFPREALGADGLIGLDALAGFELRIDLRRRTVGLRPATDSLLAINPTDRMTGTRLGRQTAGRSGKFGQMLLPTDVEDIRLEAFIDSGAQYSIGNMALLNALGPRAPVAQLTGAGPDPRVHGVAGGTLDAQVHEVRGVRIAGRRLGPMRMMFADLHVFEAMELQSRPALLVGADILGRFGNIWLNFARSQILLGSPRRDRASA